MGAFAYERNDLDLVIEQPHYLGHLVGKTLLTELHSDWITSVWDSDDHESLWGHRGSYKTTAIGAIGSLRWHLFNPNDRIAIIRKPYTKAAEVLRMIRSFYQLPEVQSLFYYAHGFYPEFIQKKENSLIFNFKRDVTPEGSIDAHGMDKDLTGYHYDKILLDDFITLQDRISKAERESTKLKVMEILTNIIDPGKQCMFIGTPWHKHDAWENVPEPQKFDIHDTNLLSEIEVGEKRKRTTSSLFACNYLLEHLSDEDMIFTDPIKDRWDPKLKIVGHLDAKYSGECYNALTFMAKKPDGTFQAVGWVFEEHIKEKIKWVVEKCRKYRVTKVYNEDNPDKGFTADLLKKEHLNVQTYHEKMNKHVKIVAYLKDAWTNISWALETQDEYLEMITDYMEKEKPDDPPDSAASLLREAFYSKGDWMALYRP